MTRSPVPGDTRRVLDTPAENRPRRDGTVTLAGVTGRPGGSVRRNRGVPVYLLVGSLHEQPWVDRLETVRLP